MTCEFNPGRTCERNAVVCNSGEPLRQMQEKTPDISLAQIRTIVCNSNDPGRDCPAYKSLVSDGQRSPYARR